jgi:hypothetical protein
MLSKEVGIEVNAEETKYICICMSRPQNAGQNHNIKIPNKGKGKVVPVLN